MLQELVTFFSSFQTEAPGKTSPGLHSSSEVYKESNMKGNYVFNRRTKRIIQRL